MTKNQFSNSLSWEDFQSLGNPSNADQASGEKSKDESFNISDKLRIYLEKKGRRGKSVTLIKGLTLSETALNNLTKELKTKCGVGGSIKDGEIMLQGDKRHKVIEILQLKGYNNVKNAGS